ncbi:MAG TPA: hypothetical protein VFP42_09425 [Acidimicrobiia bacterium]|nr:hypothetical protein [Acidimicrobiia bacterium]
MKERTLVVVSLLTLIAACSPAETSSSSTSIVSTTSFTPTTTVSTTTTTTTTTTTFATTTTQGDTVTVLLYPFSEMGEEWTEIVFPYGEGPELLGTSPGGDGLTLGPEYGAQTGDGVWWFMDAGKLRIARYEEDGSYLDELQLPPDVLVSGIYFQFQNPIALDDGTVLASGYPEENLTSILTITSEAITSTNLDRTDSWLTTDGLSLFGFSAEDQSLAVLDPEVMVATSTEWFLTRSGDRYMVSIEGSSLSITLPDQGVTKTLQLRFSEDPSVEVGAAIEVETGVDGTIFILFYGAPSNDESMGIGGFVSIGPDGTVSESEPVVNLFTPADPGSPSHLGVTPETSNPWIMVVAEDGVHVYLR